MVWIPVDKRRQHDELLLGGLPDDDWPAMIDEEIERCAAAIKRETKLRSFEMATIKIEGLICAVTSEYSDHVSYSFLAGSSNFMTEHGYLEVCKHTLEFEIPADFNIVAAKVGALNNVKAALEKAFHKRIAEINDKISNLTCLEFNPTEPVTSVDDHSDEIPF